MRKPALLVALLLTTAIALGAPINYGPAIERQRARVAAEPDNAGAHNDLANLLVLVGNYEEAERTYREAISLDPKVASTHFNLGLLLQERGASTGAMLEFRRTIDLDPSHAWAHYQTGVIYAGWHLKTLAIRAYAKALSLDPRLGNPRYNPHMIANPLGTQAMLKAYRKEMPEATPPTVFDDASGIARMLVFESAPKSEVTEPKSAPAPVPTPTVISKSSSAAGSAAGTSGSARARPAPPAAVEPYEKPEPPAETGEENAEPGYLEVKVQDDPGSGAAKGVPALGVLAPGSSDSTSTPESRLPLTIPPPGIAPVPTPAPTPSTFAPGTYRPGPGFDPNPASTGRMTTGIVPLGH